MDVFKINDDDDETNYSNKPVPLKTKRFLNFSHTDTIYIYKHFLRIQFIVPLKLITEQNVKITYCCSFVELASVQNSKNR